MLEKIQKSLNSFSNGNLTENAVHLFQTLGYESERQLPFENKSFADFENYISDESKFSEKNALASEWQYIDLLFQLTESELKQQNLLFDADNKVDQRIASYLFFVIELTEANYSRTKLSRITREVNKVFEIPVMILFKYGSSLTLAVIDREPNKQDESKDVLRKVTLIKDIRFQNPHAAHRLILEDLSLPEIKSNPKFTINNFLDLHNAWRKVLDTKELNKRFFKELANWYFWAVETVEFPADEEKNTEVRNATSVIRLITRLMFVWFLKEKGLVSDKLFDENYLKTILKSFRSESTLQREAATAKRGAAQTEVWTLNSAFYKAILQNLFFATLNSEMGKREFATEEKFHGKSRHYGVYNVFRYKQEFLNPDETLKNLFEPIPFLNGGLFECLDKPKSADGTQCEVRIDGFSDNKKNVLSVPDELFFGAEREIDLSEIYGDKKKAKSKVRGLINILDSYKFTVAENTPIEEEIALDPELLGKVFENLLASYNPETKTTARKQTGSFYTPREIVNYMVDESLIAYLKARLESSESTLQREAATAKRGAAQTEVWTLNLNEERLRDLFSYSESERRFSDAEVDVIIQAIDECKILDPACGSGAFPTGILQRLVFLLKKLDPNNEKWREWQRQKAVKETEEAYKIGDKQERKDKLLEINDIFENNASDYGRKLFLIENCIYGVDIQPIAIQIAKLRFFISLIVDQEISVQSPNFSLPSPRAKQSGDNARENENSDETNPASLRSREHVEGWTLNDNLGIRPLPNLETKFVAANTLIGLETQGGLKPTKVNELEKQLKEVRAKHFSARTRKTKENQRAKDKEIRLEIADLLKQGGIKADIADQIASWNPYDQNASADWFDAKYMFGVENSFDIVIGNPPYGVSIKGEYRKQVQNNLGKVPDFEIYYYFAEIAHKLLSHNGIKSYIIPNTFLFNVFAANYREKLFDKWKLNCIVDCTAFKVFEGATVLNTITIFEKGRTENIIGYKNTQNSMNFVELTSKVTSYITKKALLVSNQNWGLAFKLGNEVLNLLDKIKAKARRLETVLPEFSQGLIAYDKYQGQTEEIIQSRAFHYTQKVKTDLKKWLWGEDVTEYNVSWNGREWIDYCSGIANPRHPKFFKGKRILIREITNPSIFCAYTEHEFYHDPAIIVVLDNADFNLKFALGFLNSKLATFYHFNSSPKATKGAFPKILVEDIKNFPIPKANDAQQTEIAEIVDEIIEAKKAKADTSKLEEKIDDLVFDLYELTEDEKNIVRGKV